LSEGAIQTGQPAHYIEFLRTFKAKEDIGENQDPRNKAKRALAKARTLTAKKLEPSSEFKPS
jgi:hypothetical protein